MAESFHLKRQQGQFAKTSVTQMPVPRGGQLCPESNFRQCLLGGGAAQSKGRPGKNPDELAGPGESSGATCVARDV